MSLTSIIAKIGQDDDFIAFNAHWGFAFFCVAIATHHGVSFMVAAIAGIALAAVKEFWFDIRYETAQTWQDGVLDFSGYAVGIMLARWC